jgi:ParB family chromosome partitioning protein
MANGILKTLDAGREEIFLVDPSKLTVITDAKHPLYDPRVERPFEEAMVKNIMVNGVIEPLIVKKDGEASLVVIDGRQRRVNAIEANRRFAEQGIAILKVPCRLRKGDDKALFGVMIGSNEIRSNDELYEKITKAKRSLDMGYTNEEIAVQFGVHLRTVENWMAYLDCTASVQKAVREGTLTMTAALKFSKLSEDDQRTALAEAKANGPMKGAAASAAATQAVAEVKASKSKAGRPKGSGAKTKEPKDEQEKTPGALPSRSPKFLKRWRIALTDQQTSHDTSKADARLAGQVRDVIAFIYSGDLKELSDLPECIKTAAKAARKAKKA